LENNKPSFSKFGKDFQESLCQMILQDRPFADTIMEVLDIGFLELHYLRVFVQKIFEYREEFGVHPTYKIMIAIIRAEIEGENAATQQQLRNYFARIHDAQVSGSDYIKRTALDFCRKQKLKEAMIKSVPLLEKSSFDQIAKIINDAIKLGDHTDHGYDYIKDFEKRFELKARNPITTGWSQIDELCKGGLGKGELGVVIAPTGAGKSMALVHLGAQALKEKKTVVHYTLELGDTVVASRYDSCLTKIPLSHLHSFKEEIYEKVQDMEGVLIVKEYPTKSASTRSLRTHLEKLQMRDIHPDMVIVDYGDLLRPISGKSEKRHELESIYEEMRGLAREFNCCLWTASQTNRSGLNAEVITMESISEAFNKCFVSDFIFSLSRTVEDKQSNTGRIFVAKNRNGPDGLVFPLSMQTANVQIEVLQPTGEEPSVISSRDQSEILKEKYKKFRKQQKEKGN
jgi:CRISPR/Cas system-associated endonuclease/helicase Cas3